MRLVCIRRISTKTSHRWFRAVDIPEVKPGIYEYKATKRPTQFEAFSLADSARLEEAFQKNERFAPVETDGLFTVDFERRLCRPTFWDGPAFAVRRSLWFELLSNGKVVPLSAELEQEIEEHFQKQPDKPIELNWPSANGSVRVFGTFATTKNSSSSSSSSKSSSSSNAAAATAAAAAAADGGGMEPTLTLNERSSWLAAFSKRHLYRGMPTPACLPNGIVKTRGLRVRPEFKEREIRHLVFCVHGIGQLLSIKFEQINFVKDVDALRAALLNTYTKLRADDPGQGLRQLAVDCGVQVLPVMWRLKIDDKINGLRPHQLFGTTNLAADAVLDYVMYTEPKQRRLIQTAAASEMNRMYRKFCELHPQDREHVQVSIVGHSLGSVIAYDLMNPDCALADLDFPVKNIFTLGSPVGVIDLIRQAPGVTRGRAQNMYNIMRLADPVAARLEPLVTSDSLSVSPKPLPGGGTNLLQQFRELTGDLASHSELLTSKAFSLLRFLGSEENKALTKRPSSDHEVRANRQIDLQKLKEYNRHGRLDFSVQESMDLSLFLGLAGHLMYLDNPDVVQFILKELLEL